MRSFLCILSLLYFLLPCVGQATDARQFRAWIAEMKEAPRGPFKRVRWYCNDGRVLEPEPYACVERGGGLQYGEWNQKARLLRQAGYQIANVLAVYSEKNDHPPPVDPDTIKQILLERFLIGYDDGWIMRKARYYRGAFQVDDEVLGSQTLLKKLITTTGARQQNYLLLMEAYRLLPQSGGSALATRMRDKATAINEKDPQFERLRAKLHTQPEFTDAKLIREYAEQRGSRALRNDYLKLASLVDQLFAPQSLGLQIRRLANTNITKTFRKKLLLSAATLNDPNASAEIKLIEASHLLAELRENCDSQPIAGQVRILQLAQAIEQTVFATASDLLKNLNSKTRLERLGWLRHTAQAIYGTGMISKRQWLSVQESLDRIETGELTVGEYHAELRYLNRLPGWAGNWLGFHFQPTIQHLDNIEPLAQQFIPARLRGSPLQFYIAVLDSLLQDANRLAGIKNSIFGEVTGSGLRPLNAGLARGRLLVPEKNQPLDARSIYLLQETTTELTPVAGILTKGEGNALSHVQLLAANLGIPNVVVNDSITAGLQNHIGEKIILAVSPGGVVQLAKDDSSWDALLNKTADNVVKGRIVPDLEKLNLTERDFKLLSELRASDSGKIVGPKAANLGELKYHFPEAVVEGVVIPFGIFRKEILEQPVTGYDGTLFDWIKQYYRYLETLSGDEKDKAVTTFLKSLRTKILQTRFPDTFRNRLKSSLEQTFGANGSYAVFVRSDTNVEDLPEFTGAGLNLTVPNVVGFEKILDAILRVWASPFSERAFAWRQGRMEHPEHVYPSIILMKSVPVDKSGVMITQDTETGDPEWLSVATNHGIGGAVQGQVAEELRIHLGTGEIRLLADATSPEMRMPDAVGGLKRVAAPASGFVLTQNEVFQLLQLVQQIKTRFPQYNNPAEPLAADIEFGFEKGALRLFQVRPYLRSQAARNHQYLIELDQSMKSHAGRVVDLSEVPQ